MNTKDNDIVERLNVESEAESWGLLVDARDEIERLRAALEVIGTDALADLMDAAASEHGRLLDSLAAERALADQLAGAAGHALCGNGVLHAIDALAVWQEARRER